MNQFKSRCFAKNEKRKKERKINYEMNPLQKMLIHLCVGCLTHSSCKDRNICASTMATTIRCRYWPSLYMFVLCSIAAQQGSVFICTFVIYLFRWQVVLNWMYRNRPIWEKNPSRQEKVTNTTEKYIEEITGN